MDANSLEVMLTGFPQTGGREVSEKHYRTQWRGREEKANPEEMMDDK